MTKLLRSHGITPTIQRVKIASAILARPQHLSAEDAMQLSNESGKTVSKATVYNTLGLFARKGLIRELIVDPSRTFYDSSTHSHHHFYNPETQELSDIDEELIQISLPENLPENTEIDSIEVVVHLRGKTSH
ncbi:Fur family transcriptional regulator [Candidatus Vondammii sp. HM_W22]|uniref:Fur family transcriptional regulator n=1 Tax=Candidatus Vondammii sp. HM_W22 TaxID=2687299 RepID=UPI001F14774F|nr:transcriptional repressor [Candidatus Vondammii sp. HM_W22]